MNVTTRPSVERLSAISDLDEKLVTTRLPIGWSRRSECWGPSTSSELMNLPDGSSWSSTIFAVMPKLLSTTSLLKTNGYAPPSVAVTQLGATQLGGSTVVPATTFSGLL